MADPRQLYYNKRGEILVKNLKSRHFDAWYCENKEEALAKALELIPRGAKVAWGGALSADQIGLTAAVRNGTYCVIDRSAAKTPEEQKEIIRNWLFSDVFISGANALSLDGQMVSVDGTGNRVAAICYGPDTVLVIAGMNKVEDTLEAAINRARTVAAPMNKQRFQNQTPCMHTGVCADCKSEGSICNQIVITRLCRPAGRIKFIIVGEDLGF